jgi:hypothetical protein
MPIPSPGAVPLWSHALPDLPRGLALLRETSWTLVWDDKHWLHLFNRSGALQGQVRPAEELVTACGADDGSSIAAAGGRGKVWWFAPDLTIRWEQTIGDKALAAAMDPFGQYLAVADARGRLHVFDRKGRPSFQLEVPRPLHHLAFVPAAPYLVGSSDFGLVACLEWPGRWAWRDGLVAHTGALTVNGTGDLIVLACFTEGLRRYSVKDRAQGRLPVGEPCRLASVSFDGNLILAADLAHRLLLFDRTGQTLYIHPLAKPPVSLALSPLGDTAVVALAGGQVTALDLRSVLRTTATSASSH